MSHFGGWSPAVLLVVSSLTVSVSAPPAESRDVLSECEARLLTTFESWESYCFVRLAREHGLWTEALRRAEGRLRGDPTDRYLQFTLGVLHVEGGDQTDAVREFRAAAQAFSAQGELEAAALAWMNVGEALKGLGELDATELALERALEAARETEDPGLKGRVVIRQIQVARLRGEDLEHSLRRLRDLERTLPRNAPYEILRLLLYEQAALLGQLGRPAEARALNERWAELATAANYPGQAATARINVVLHLLAEPPRTGLREEATRLGLDALDLAERAENRDAALTAHRILGQLLGGERGRSHLEQCLRLAVESGKLDSQATCHFALASHLVWHNSERAQRELDRALTLARASDKPWTTVYGWADRFQVAWTTRSRPDAAVESLEVLDQIEALRRRQISDEGRAGLFSDWVAVYHSLAGYLLDAPDGPSRGELEIAFHVAERMRARVLLDHLAGGIVPAEQEIATLPGIEAALAPHQAMLAFLVAPDEDIYGKLAGGSWLLAVTHDGTRAHRLPDRLALEAKVGTFVTLAESRQDAALPAGSATLHRDLLAPALAALPAGVDELIVVPDGILQRLPFALLRPAPEGRPLSATHRLSQAPSATLWHRWRHPSEALPPAALALADPAFVGSGSPAAIGAAPATDRQWTMEHGARLGRLPHAEDEGRRLVRRLGGPPSRLWLGKEASEAALGATPLGDYGILHFAAHALVDDERPGRSAVLLAAGSPTEDGLLQPEEIARLELPGKLVVLSACESGAGQMMLGEGTLSLARAFFQAGARTVVASLWRLDDDEAATFFDLFYRALAAGHSVSGALTASQRELQRRGAPAAAWAGVVVLGDGALVPVPGGVRPSPTRRFQVWISVAILVGALVWWLRRRS